MCRFLAFAVLVSCGFAPGADFCALTVTVVDPGGGRTTLPLPVALLDSSGSVVQRTILERGQASFCDFGLGDHSVVVGSDLSCSPVIVQHVRLVFGHHQNLYVVDNELECPGNWDGGSLNCGFYLRIRSETGEKLGGAELWTGGK